jgi:Flp pilus assembly pilin Flp
MDAVFALVHRMAPRPGGVNGEEGQDLIEYGLLVALIAIVAMAAVTTVGSTVNTMFWQTIPNAL